MRREKIGRIEITCEDCMDLMARYPDKHFCLAIVDPPYGQGGNCTIERTGGRSKKYKTNGINKITIWDIAPTDTYFTELFRVSTYQIIWGGNYFGLPASRNFIVWRKLTISDSFSMAMAEYAWTNIQGNAKVFEFQPQDPARIHPTQKPVALYKWLLSKYAKPGWKILDTHLGSGSHAVACYDMGIPLTACEIDEDYFDAAVGRLRQHAAQGTLEFGGGE